jgi:putative hydrolase of the HAD superfamily
VSRLKIPWVREPYLGQILAGDKTVEVRAGYENIRRFDAVLFDLGYTLVYFDPPQEAIVQEALRAAGAERSTAEVRAAVERVWGALYRDAETARFPASEEYDRQAELELSRSLLQALGVESGDEVLRAYRRALDESFGRPGVLRPYPEAPEVLDTLRSEGYRLGIVSNWGWSLRHRVQGAGLEGYFELVWGSAYAGCNKPHPCIFEQALTQMGLEPARVVYVGDNYRHDVLGARGAGMAAVLVDRSEGGTPRDCPVIADLRGVLSLLSQM